MPAAAGAGTGAGAGATAGGQPPASKNIEQNMRAQPGAGQVLRAARSIRGATAVQLDPHDSVQAFEALLDDNDADVRAMITA